MSSMILDIIDDVRHASHAHLYSEALRMLPQPHLRITQELPGITKGLDITPRNSVPLYAVY